MDKEGLFSACETHPSGAIEKARQPLPRLLGRGGREPFALASGLWFGFGLWRLLNFFSAFVFASHA